MAHMNNGDTMRQGVLYVAHGVPAWELLIEQLSPLIGESGGLHHSGMRAGHPVAIAGPE